MLFGSLLESFLNSPPRICFTHQDTFTGHRTDRSRIVSHRYIRILRGTLSYMIDQTEAPLHAGTIFFVPCGSQREWKVPSGEVCEILWCEFNSPGALQPDPHTLYFADDSKRNLEKAALTRIARLWSFPRHLRDGHHGDHQLPPEVALVLEGELKASLARFWTAARPWKPGVTMIERDADRVHPSISRALGWMEENFRHPDAQKLLFEKGLEMSPNHFRMLFRRYAGVSISAHLHKLRMTEAMNLLRFSDRSVKEVAASVGFNDPLYFSRRFHEHWDIAPSAVRK
jgi:AraC-like DNA-binding protein